MTIERDERPRIDVVETSRGTHYVAKCPKCYWACLRHDPVLIKEAMKAHKASRLHKVNTAAPHRFIV